MSFLVGGGSSDETAVRLYSLEDKLLLTASGAGGPALQRVNWDVSKYVGSSVYLRIVDSTKRSWGHVTFDDFSCAGTIDATQRHGEVAE